MVQLLKGLGNIGTIVNLGRRAWREYQRYRRYRELERARRRQLPPPLQMPDIEPPIDREPRHDEDESSGRE